MGAEEEAKELLKAGGLRATPTRLTVLRALLSSSTPLAWAELTDQLDGVAIDPATVYRNLVKLSEAGVLEVVGHFDGRDRYAVAKAGGAHRHPHFVCEDCGLVACLPDDLVGGLRVDGPWSASVRSASLQLRGACPDCFDRAHAG